MSALVVLNAMDVVRRIGLTESHCDGRSSILKEAQSVLAVYRSFEVACRILPVQRTSVGSWLSFVWTDNWYRRPTEATVIVPGRCHTLSRSMDLQIWAIRFPAYML